MPGQEEESKRLSEQLKAETDVSQAMEQATPDEKLNWHHQENDPQHVHSNAYTAAEQNQAHAQTTDLSQQSFSPMSETAKNDVMQSISSDLGSLTQQIEQMQALNQQQTR